MLQKKWLKTLVPIGLLFGGVLLYANREAESVDPYDAPGWELRNLDGDLVSSADFEGQVVVLNFWATWCPPCRVEIPGFVDVQREYADQGMTIVGISLDEAPTEVVRRFSEEYTINYPVLMGDSRVVRDFGGIRALPTTFFIDREGKVRNVHKGYLTKSALEKTLKTLL